MNLRIIVTLEVVAGEDGEELQLHILDESEGGLLKDLTRGNGEGELTLRKNKTFLMLLDIMASLYSLAMII